MSTTVVGAVYWGQVWQDESPYAAEARSPASVRTRREEGSVIVDVTVEQPDSSLENPDLPADLLVISLSGVQTFITESRATADLSAGSIIVARLSTEIARACSTVDGSLVVFPVGRIADGQDAATDSRHVPATPNRVVVRVRPGAGEDMAEKAVGVVHERWREWVRLALNVPEPVETPGMPSVQWVVVPAGVGGYAAQWTQAQSALGARKRIRDFAAPPKWDRRPLCTLSARWPAVDKRPPGVPDHQFDQLSAANWVKRRWRKVVKADPEETTVGFASTSSVASAPYRREVLARLDSDPTRKAARALRQAWTPLGAAPETPVPGLAQTEPGLSQWLVNGAGVWVYPETWHIDRLRREFPDLPEDVRERVARQGRAAALALAAAVADPGVPARPPASYLAVLAQDLDDMGKFLSGAAPARSGAYTNVSPRAHADVSRRLGEVAREQRERLSTAEVLGTPVYAGGDDLLAFLPAETALRAARLCHDAVPDDLPTASTAVLFFHRTASLRHALAEVRDLLTAAKSVPGKDALAVGFLRRSGVSERSVQPWSPPHAPGGRSAADLFEIFIRRGRRGVISPRLVNVLERDAAELRDLPDEWYRAELTRVVQRHGGDRADAEALRQLSYDERATPRPERAPAGRVAVFLRQECRPCRAEATGPAGEVG